MFSSESFLFFITLLLLAIITEPVAKRLKVPFSIILILMGYLGSEFLINQLKIDTGIRWDNFHLIIFHVLIPSLIFQAALTLDLKALKQNLGVVLTLALPMMLLGTFITAAIVYYAIDHPVGFPWIAALILGALLSATDPAAVLSVLKGSNTPERLKNILEGESLFNDATSVVLFTVLISIAVMGPGESPTWLDAVIRFIQVFLGGIVLGLLIGFIAHLILSRSHSNSIQGLVTVLTAYGSFIVAEDLFHVSGVMAVLAAGIMVRLLNVEKLSANSKHFMQELWELFGHISESLLFILAGITVSLSMFTDQWLAILFAIGAVLLTRMVLISSLFSIIGLFSKDNKTSMRQQVFLVWGGVRGTVTIALALSIPLALDYYYTIQSVAYGVVLFTLFFQATTINFLSRRL